MLKTNFHISSEDTIRCHGSSTGSVFIVATAKGRSDYTHGPQVSLFFSVAQARELHAQMAKAIAEHDLIEAAKAQAKAQAEAA